MKNFFRKLQDWLKAHGEIVAVLGVLSGSLIGIGIPLWQIYWVDTPRLNVEIYAIDRIVPPDARIAFDDDDLKVLANRPFAGFAGFLDMEIDPRISMPPIGNARRSERGYTPKEADELLALAKQDYSSLPERLKEREKEFDQVTALTPETLTTSDVRRLNTPLSDEYNVDPRILSAPTPEGLAKRKEAIDHFREAYRKRLESVQVRYNEYQAKLPNAERRLAEIKRDMENQKSLFQITTVLSNSGRKSVSIRQSALCRVYIGKGNYVDIKLSLKDIKESAEVSPNGTKIASFSSEPMESFPPDDRQLIGTYWGQSVHAILFIEDISGYIHNSNRISFARGAYQKAIFDRLTGEASKPGYQIRDQ